MQATYDRLREALSAAGLAPVGVVNFTQPSARAVDAVEEALGTVEGMVSASRLDPKVARWLRQAAAELAAHDESGEFEGLLEKEGSMSIHAHVCKTYEDLELKDDRQIATISSFRCRFLRNPHASATAPTCPKSQLRRPRCVSGASPSPHSGAKTESEYA